MKENADHCQIIIWLTTDNNSDEIPANDELSVVWMASNSYLLKALKTTDGNTVQIINNELKAVNRLHSKCIRELIQDRNYAKMMGVLKKFITYNLVKIQQEHLRLN